MARRDRSPPILVPLFPCSPAACWLTADMFGSSELLEGILKEFFNVVSLLGISASGIRDATASPVTH